MKYHRWVFSILVLILTLGLVAEAQAKRIRMGLPAVSMGGMPYFLARDKGYYKEEGLDVELIVMFAPLVNTALIAGELDVSMVLVAGTMVALRGAPLINIFVARTQDGTEALAVLTIVYTLGHIPYGWLNEVRNLPTAFREEGDLPKIRRFVLGCCLFSFAWMVAFFWTPVADHILGTWIGIGPELIAHCGAPLFIFSFFPFVVSLRGYIHGIGLLQHRTQAMAPSAPSRLATVLLMLTLLSGFEMHGATRAVGALISGHTVEALVVWWSIMRRGSGRVGG